MFETFMFFNKSDKDQEQKKSPEKKSSILEEIKDEEFAQQEIENNRVKDLPDMECEVELPAETILRPYVSYGHKIRYFKLKQPATARVEERGRSNYENSRIIHLENEQYYILGEKTILGPEELAQFFVKDKNVEANDLSDTVGRARPKDGENL